MDAPRAIHASLMRAGSLHRRELRLDRLDRWTESGNRWASFTSPNGGQAGRGVARQPFDQDRTAE
jgi:hypothetical protein